MKKILTLAVVLGLLVCQLSFAGEFVIKSMKFDDGTPCTIPSDWKLVSIVSTAPPFVSVETQVRLKLEKPVNFVTGLIFQDKDGNVYLLKIKGADLPYVPTVEEIVYKINSKK